MLCATIKYSLLALLVTFTVVAQSRVKQAGFNFTSQLGVAEEKQAEICLTIPNAKLRENSDVRLVPAYKPQRVAKAVVLKKLSNSCSRNPDTSGEDSFYSLKLVEGNLEESAVAIAYVGSTSPIKLKNGFASVDLDRDGRTEAFHVCTSMEGLHLTVWSGQPLKGKRKWHWYYYLGYDVEPSCTDEEART